MYSFRQLFIVVLILLLQNAVEAQQINTSTSNPEIKAVKSQLVFHGMTSPIGEVNNPNVLTPNNKRKRAKRERRARIPNFEYNVPMANNNPNPLPQNGDPLIAPPSFTAVTGIEVIPDLIFDGMEEEELLFVSVPDDNGDVSPDHYIQTANSSEGAYYEIFDKDGVTIFGPESCQDFWTPFNANGLGDPVVLWDQEASRWVITELSFDFTSMLIAISETDDPLGSWYVYEFQSPFGLPDYPKYGIWSDGYYVTTNEYITDGDLSNHIPIYIMERDKMLNGDTDVEVQMVGIPKFQESTSDFFVFQTATPANWEGTTLPPADSGFPVVRIYDDAWDGGVDQVELWEIVVDWDDENNTVISGPNEMPTAAFDSNLCDGDIFNCIQESDGSFVSALQQIVMNRVTYRNFTSYESIVMTFSVNVDQQEKRAGVRWCELRRTPGADWSLYQEGTVSNETNHIFMPTIGMDASGSIALGYSEMGPDKFLSLSFTGRRSSDELGEMTVEPYEIATGQSYHDGNRWGDYASMSVDPVDGRTFWFSGEYTKEDNIWGTKIATFQIRRDTNDVGPFSLTTPVTSALLTNSETVEAVYKNFGYNPQADFEVGYIFDGLVSETQMITDTLQPDSSVTVVFTMPVDMDEVRAYDFKLFTGMVNDENSLNDTLRVVVEKQTRWDAAITGFSGIEEGFICNSSYVTDIALLNVGQEILTAATIYWQFNGGTINQEDWTGNLAPGESDLISVTLTPLLDGNNTLLAYSSNPNGIMDEDVSNDTLNRNFMATTDGRTITLEIETDFFTNENTWDLFNDNGDLLYTGGPYNQPQATITEEWCLPLGCYTFVFYDLFGNGIFLGGYTIIDDDGTELAALINPNFGFEESNDFCINFQCMLSADLTPSAETAPGASDGAIIVSTNNGTAPFDYSLNGNPPQSTPVISGLPAGNYTVIVTDANDCTAEVEVNVPVCNITFSVTVAQESVAGANDGAIDVTVGSGNAPYEYSIDNGTTFQSSPLFENLGSGNYTILIKDNFACERTIDVEISTLSGLDETTYGTSVKVYPNPSSDGYVVIDVHGLNNAQFVYYDVMDVSGKVVQRARLAPVNDYHTGRFSIADFPDGVYFVRFKHEQLDEAVRVVKKGS